MPPPTLKPPVVEPPLNGVCPKKIVGPPSTNGDGWPRSFLGKKWKDPSTEPAPVKLESPSRAVVPKPSAITSAPAAKFFVKYPSPPNPTFSAELWVPPPAKMYPSPRGGCTASCAGEGVGRKN